MNHYVSLDTVVMITEEELGDQDPTEDVLINIAANRLSDYLWQALSHPDNPSYQLDWVIESE